MNRHIEQALIGLVPAHNGPLPPELLGLATSILAQSRTKAATMKADEEIARTYVCAHIACERLKQRLHLPKIEARPPIPPRLYKKVYTYINNAIPSPSSRTTVQQGTSSTYNNTPESSPVRKTVGKYTPRKISLSTRTAPRRSLISRKQAGSMLDIEPPEWIMPAIRHLCRDFELPSAAPHVFSGVRTVLKMLPPRSHSPVSSAIPLSSADSSSAPHPGADNEDSRLPALILAILFHTLAKLCGTKLKGHNLRDMMSKGVASMRETDAVKSMTEDLQQDVLRFVQEGRNSWIELDWYHNIVPGSGCSKTNQADKVGHPKLEMTDRKKTPNLSGCEKSNKLLCGLGTMMQMTNDYLSDERRADFLEWKKDIMARVEEYEASSKSKLRSQGAGEFN